MKSRNKKIYIILLFIVDLFPNLQADVCQTCLCSTGDDTTISIDCHEAKVASINILRFGLISVEYNGTLGTINLSQNNITYLPADLFKSSRHLKLIDLSHNLLQEIHSNIFKNLNSLEVLDLSNNKIKVFYSTKLSSLRIMNLSHNEIKDLDFEFHEAYCQLNILNLSHNELDDSMNATLTLLKNLQHLDFSYNNFNLLDNEDFNLLPQLKSLNLSHNSIKSLEKQVFPKSLSVLDVGFNYLTSLPTHLENTQSLNIEYNKISTVQNTPSIGNQFFQLKYLNLSGNSLKELSNLKLTNLTILDLSFNEFTIIPNSLNNKNYPKLETLIFDGNPMTKIEFPSYLNIKSLIMSGMNDLERIDEDSFKNLYHFENDCMNFTLINNKKLQFLHERAFEKLNLCFLNLKNNQFSYFAPQLFDNGLKTKFGVDLEGNPFNCNCSLQWMLDKFIPWLYSTNPNLLNNLRCETPEKLHGKRMVHWYKWDEQVLCNSPQLFSSRMTAETLEVLSRSNPITLHTSNGMVIVIVVTVLVLLVLVIVGIILAKRVALKNTRINRRF